MAHFVQVDENNVCGQVIVVRNEDILDEKGKESEAVGQAFIKSLGLEGRWLQTSYNNNFRGRYAAGCVYDPDKDEFVFSITE